MLLEDIGPDDEKSLGEMLLLDNEEVDDDDLLIWELDAWYTDTDTDLQKKLLIHLNIFNLLEVICRFIKIRTQYKNIKFIIKKSI